MKKILLLFSICLIPMLGYAQTDENGKERVYIDYFSRPGTISNILAEALRNKVTLIPQHYYKIFFLST